MHTFIGIAAYLLIGVAVAPLLLLGLYVLADRLGLAVADRMLSLTARILQLQWLSGGVVNIIGGLLIAALGIWAALSLEPPLYRLAGALLVPFGLWRAFRGVAVLKAFSSNDE
jgi:tryptophan-rich sensory protein